MSAQVITVPVLRDNYAYLVQSGDSVVVVDPGQAQPILDVLNDRALKPTHVIITHYDYDHIDGLAPLVEAYQPEVIGPEPSGVNLDRVCRDGDVLALNGFSFRVIHTPGHYIPHVAFYEEKRGWLFSGDSLFGSGCGRVRNGAYEDMWRSLHTISKLPDDTHVYFGHEYTLANLAFAESIEPENAFNQVYRQQLINALERGGISSPSTIGVEKQSNPFLRVHLRHIRNRLGLHDSSDADAFTALRKAKDAFSG